MTDIRDGERLPDIRGKQAYRQPDGCIALWDGERHVIIGPRREGLRVALTQMKLAREWAEQQAAILANVRPENRDEVAYAIRLAEALCPICEGTGRATWLDDCQECASAEGEAKAAPDASQSPGKTS